MGWARCERTNQAAFVAPNGLLRRHASGAAAGHVPGLVHDVLRSPGRPLDVATRASMEQRFGRDFSGIRVHDDAKASRSAAAVQADAYTAGRDIVFARGRYSPQTQDGVHLLAHELAHASQDGARRGAMPSQIGAAHSHEEHAANRAADEVVQGRRVSTAGADASKLHRQANLDPQAARDRIIALAESDKPADRQRALDLIVDTYFGRPPNYDGIFYDPNLHSTSPQDAETGPSQGQASFGGRQRTTIGPGFFHEFRRRYIQRVRTIGHELQHVGQRSPAGNRSFLSTLGGAGVGAAIGAAAGGIGLGIAAAAGVSLSGGLIGGVLGAAGGVGGLIGGILDPFAGKDEPVRNSHTREFLAIHWTLTAQVRGLGDMPRGQALQALNLPRVGALAEYDQMPAADQKKYRRQYEQLLQLKQRLEAEGEAKSNTRQAQPNTQGATP
jgi:hypothetical protein